MDFHVVLDAFRRNIHLFFRSCSEFVWVLLAGSTGSCWVGDSGKTAGEITTKNAMKRWNLTSKNGCLNWLNQQNMVKGHIFQLMAFHAVFIFLCLWPEAVIEKWRPQKDAVYRRLTTPKDGATRIVMDKQGTLAFINITCGHLCLDISYINLQERIHQPQIRVKQRISVHIVSH